jgi:ABC-type branched-subunit amino acid transport system ATPase component
MARARAPWSGSWWGPRLRRQERLPFIGAVKFTGVSEAIAAGIVPIYQQSTLFPNLSVLENLFAFLFL